MLQALKQQNKLHITLLLLGMSLFCFFLSVIRCAYSDTITYLFLNWNLFLAFVPWAFSTLIIIKPGWNSNKLIVWLSLFCWLLFFPNAPYILTDLFHLRVRETAPVWFDLVLILSFAWTGLLFGFTSLFDIEQFMQRFLRKSYITLISVLFLFIGSFGIYLGRYQRWNSWDILHEPMGLLYDIADRFAQPSAHPRTWGVTIFMGILLNMIYFSFKLLRTPNHKS